MRWSELNQKQKQNFIRLAVLALLGVGLLLAGGQTGQQNETQNPDLYAQSVSPKATSQNSTVGQMEQQLEQTLMKVKDAGQVTVQIAVHTMGRKEYACDVQKTERRTIEENGEQIQETVEQQEQRSVVQPAGQQGGLLIEETMPEIRGVLIVASGASHAVVQEQLLQAASTLLEISAEKIVVLPGTGGDEDGTL